MKTDYYSILGVSNKADADGLTDAYRAKIATCHPQHFHSRIQKEVLLEELEIINEAYHILYNPETRARYDATHIPIQNSHQGLSNDSKRLLTLAAILGFITLSCIPALKPILTMRPFLFFFSLILILHPFSIPWRTKLLCSILGLSSIVLLLHHYPQIPVFIELVCYIGIIAAVRLIAKKIQQISSTH
jgi:hypothetical protein